MEQEARSAQRVLSPFPDFLYLDLRHGSYWADFSTYLNVFSEEHVPIRVPAHAYGRFECSAHKCQAGAAADSLSVPRVNFQQLLICSCKPALAGDLLIAS